MEFLSWGTFLAAIFVGGVSVFYEPQKRYRVVFIANCVLGAAILRHSFAPMLIVGSMLFPFFQHLRGRFGNFLVYPLCLWTLAPLILLRGELELSWRGLWLSASLAFFCLQNCSAILEVYWNKAEAPQSFLRWMSFSIFFPSLIAGPVGRWSNLGPQLSSPKAFQIDDGRECIFLISQGIFKKIVFAVPLYIIVDRFFAAPREFGITAALIVAFIFRYAIWADISAHTDWAQGISRLIGIRLSSNFDNPFHTARLADFWRRWHMSLSQWLQDFVFMPLAFGPLRKVFSAKLSMVFALLIAFAFLGLWHGIALSFLLMGVYKGIGVVISEWVWKSFEKPSSNPTFGVKLAQTTTGVFFMWAFMIVPTLLIRMKLEDAIYLISTDDHLWPTSWLKLTAMFDAELETYKILWPTVLIAGAFETLQHFSKAKRREAGFSATEPCSVVSPFNKWTQVAIISVAVLLFFVFGSFTTWLGFSYVNH